MPPAPQAGDVEVSSPASYPNQPGVCPTDTDNLPPARASSHLLHPKQPLDTHSLSYILRSGLAGGMAGCAAKTLVAPLDRVKILFQASAPEFRSLAGTPFGVVKAMRVIYAREGLAGGLYRGHSATLLRIFPYAAVKFLAYEQFRGWLIPGREWETSWRRLVSGSLAGITSVFCTYPLEVIRVRLAFETKASHPSSLTAICRQIYNEHPPVPKLPSHLSSTPLATASTLATPAIRPLAGLTNFYRGFSPTLVGMLPYAGISFLTHDTAGDLLRHPRLAPYTTLPPTTPSTRRKPQLKFWAQLLSGGFAGLVSQTASYPLEVIRRRMQVGGAVGGGERVGMWEMARRIRAERGLRGFWVGLGIGYFKIVPMTATSFFVYERGKVWLGI